MSGYAIYISRKQIGVIYSNYKKNNLKLSEDIVSWLYNSCVERRYNDNNINSFLAGVKKAIDLIFENNFEKAEHEIKLAFQQYNLRFI